MVPNRPEQHGRVLKGLLCNMRRTVQVKDVTKVGLQGDRGLTDEDLLPDGIQLKTELTQPRIKQTLAIRKEGRRALQGSTLRSSNCSRAGTGSGVAGAGSGSGSPETSRRLLGSSLRSWALRRHHESLSRQQATRDFRSFANRKSQSARQAARGTKAAEAKAEIRAAAEAAERRNLGSTALTATSASDQRAALRSSRRSDSVSLSEAMAGEPREKFSLAHSTEEPQASAGELQLSW